ncbi:MAG: undecaprenyl-diphosphate phosphatase [Thermoguttaceae bacterium]
MHQIISIIVLAVVQGLAELLPVSSSAHVIVAAKLLGLPRMSEPQMTLVLVLLHTGTMFAVILYFWRSWQESIFASREVFRRQAVRLVTATLLTGVVGAPLMWGVPRILGIEKAEVEGLFDRLDLVAAALAAVGLLILVAGLARTSKPVAPGTGKPVAPAADRPLGIGAAAWIGAVQGLCLPFRGFSRSGATISTGLLLGAAKAEVEQFSFALAVIITPPAIAREVWRVIKKTHETGNTAATWSLFGPGLLGMVCAFLAGLLALRWLSRWLEGGRWYLFGVYCLLAGAAVFALHCSGY